jgi:hypothetical protein
MSTTQGKFVWYDRMTSDARTSSAGAHEDRVLDRIGPLAKLAAKR